MNALRPTREDLDAFETTYNAACASLARGDLRESELLLRRSAGLFSFPFFFCSVLGLVKSISWANESLKDICMTSDSLPEEAKATEILPILIQQLFVQIRQGKWDEADRLITEIDLNQYVYVFISWPVFLVLGLTLSTPLPLG